MSDPLCSILRAPTRDSVLKALDAACVQLPITSPAEAIDLFNCMQDQPLRVDTSVGCVGDKRAPGRMPMHFEESLHGCSAHESQRFSADNFIDLMGPGWPQGCAG